MKGSPGTSKASVMVLLTVATLMGCDRGGGSVGAAGEHSRRAELRKFWEVHDRARSLYAAGKHAAAHTAYLEALELDPRHGSTLYNLAHVEFILGRHDQSLERLQVLRELEPRETKALLLAATVRIDSRPWAPFDLGKAALLVDQALELNREESGPFLLQGKIALLAGDHDTARDRLEVALRANPRSAEAINLLGFLELWSGRAEEAAGFFSRAREAARGAPPPAGVAGEGDTSAGGAGSHGLQLLLAARLAAVAGGIAWGKDAGPLPSPPDATGCAAMPGDVRPIGGLRSGGAIAAADLDGDGALDLILGSLTGPIDLFRGVDSGFEPAGSVDVAGARIVVVADLDGDGQIDLCTVVSRDGGNDETIILRGLGPFAFEVLRPPTIDRRKTLALSATGRSGGAEVFEAGLSRDGASPLRILTVEAGRYAARDVSGFAEGDVAVSVAVLRPTSRRPALAVVALAHGTPVVLRRTEGDWKIEDAPTGLEEAGQASCLLSADIDGDAAEDLVVARRASVGETLLWLVEGKAGPPVLAVFRETGPAHFAPCTIPIPRWSGGISSLAVGDIDGDGRVDLIASAGGPEPWRIEPWWILFGRPEGLSLRRGPQIPFPVSATGAAVLGPRRLVVTTGGWLPWIRAKAWLVDIVAGQ